MINRIGLFVWRTLALLVDAAIITLIAHLLESAGVRRLPLVRIVERYNFLPFPERSEPYSFLFYGLLYLAGGFAEMVTAIVWAVYAVTTLSLFGRTGGMRLMGLRLLDGKGRHPSAFRVLARHVLASLSAIYGIGYVIALVTPGVAALHDVITNTRVIRDD